MPMIMINIEERGPRLWVGEVEIGQLARRTPVQGESWEEIKTKIDAFFDTHLPRPKAAVEAEPEQTDAQRRMAKARAAAAQKRSEAKAAAVANNNAEWTPPADGNAMHTPADPVDASAMPAPEVSDESVP